MSRSKKIYIFLGFAVFCWLLVSCWAIVSGRLGSAVDPIYGDVFTATEASPGYTYTAPKAEIALDQELQGAVIPAPAGDSVTVAQTISLLSNDWNGHLILLVTLADDLGVNAITSDREWQTSFGLLQTNYDAVDHLLQCGAVVDNEKMAEIKDFFELMPYLGQSLPNVKVIPLVFDTSASLAYQKSYMNRLAECYDGYKVLMVTPSEEESSLLFTKDIEELQSIFDEVQTVNLNGILRDTETAELIMMKHILKYDGSDVGGIVLNTAAEEPAFHNQAVLYVKGE